MGSKAEDSTTAQIHTIMRFALALRDATGIPHHPSYTPITCAPAIDSISLPSPPPLLPFLLEAGLSQAIAAAADRVYQLHSDELRRHVQESIVTACHEIAELPVVTLASSPDLFKRNVVSTFTNVYLRRLEQWKEEIIQRLKRTRKTTTGEGQKIPRAFNHEYVPLLEHFFEENPFPTHADKMFLAQKSNMEYRQIHVWFQNRRNRTKKEGKTSRKKSTYERATKPLDKLYERMKYYMVDSDSRTPKPLQSVSSEEITETEVARRSTSKDVFTSSSPPHAFPSLYPPTCHYDPFPCKSGSIYFRKPEWKRVPCGKTPLPPSASIDDLVERFSRLNVRDETRSRGSPRLQSYAATVAITVIPSPAPHPSLIISKYVQPANTVQKHPSVHAPLSHFKPFQSSSLASLVPFSVPPNKSEFPGKRDTAPLPQRFPGQMRNTERDATPSESSSTSSSSPRSFSANSELSYSSCVSSLSTPSDVANSQELPHLFGSSCRSPFDSPIRLRGLGDTVANSPVS